MGDSRIWHTQVDAFPACLVCGILIVRGASLCDECATAAEKLPFGEPRPRNSAWHFHMKFNSDGCPVVSHLGGRYKRMHDVAWLKRFERYAKGCRKITDFFKKK